MQVLGERFGINTYSYTQAMAAADCVARLAGQGARVFEIMLYPGHLWVGDGPDAVRNLRSVVIGNGLQIATLNSPNIDLNIAAATEEMRATSLRLNCGFLRLAGELGAKGLILGPGKPNPLFPLPPAVLEGHFFSALDVLVPLAERCGVRLVVENMPSAFLPAAEQVMASLDRYGHDGIGVCYDVANGHFIGEDPVAGLEAVRSRLVLIHISDTTRAALRHDTVGAGDLNFAPIPAAIDRLGYRDPILLEVISHDPDADIANSAAALAELGF